LLAFADSSISMALEMALDAVDAEAVSTTSTEDSDRYTHGTQVTLVPGTRLGPYEIVAAIGAGGMGEVYRATDSNLKRSVAIKVLPAAVAGDVDRLARFQREAEVLAALNHPNIAGIYGLEKTPDLTALVMELVEGEDLSVLIRNNFELRSSNFEVCEWALPIARQIVDALECAHENGIIHRDLKPANIRVRADGTVKVLDFGLAKALDPGFKDPGLHSNIANSPTMTSPAVTAKGIILGTAAYMSPEQAKGKAVDKRADIWAFGVVLYEMLSGRRAFDGEDVSDPLVAVLSKVVDLGALPATTPRPVVDLIRRCLVRDPKQRLRDIGDARIALDRIIAGAPDDGSAVTAAASSLRALPWAVAGTLAVALGVALWAPWRVEKPVDRPLVRLDVDLGEDAVLPSAATTVAKTILVSPDGTRLVYLAGTPRKLFTRRLDQPKATELPGTQGASFPFFSPDGHWVGFVAAGKVNKISVEGGAVVPLGEFAGAVGANWAEDGSIIAVDGFGKGLLQLPAGGSLRIIAPRVNAEALVVPQLLPGEKAMLFAACASGGADNCNIEVLTLADGRRKILARGGHSPHYLSSSNGTGHLVYINKATLFAVPFDMATLETRGTAVPVLDDVASAAAAGTGHFDVSRTGTLIYRRSRIDAAPMATVRWADPNGKKEPLRSKPASYGSSNPVFSPDGTRVAVTIHEGGSEDVWVYEPRRDALTRLTFGGFNSAPVWSPDGKYIVFAKPFQGIFQARADGAGSPQALTGSKTIQIPGSFTSDGKRLAYQEAAGRSQIWTVPLEDQGGHLKAGTPEQFLKSNFSDLNPAFSRDGRWLAYTSNESGNYEVYVRPFPPPSSGQGGKWKVSNNGAAGPQWSRTGDELLYLSGDQVMAVSYSVKGDTFVAEKPRVWIAALGGTAWDLAPDGKRVAVVIREGSPQAPQQEHHIVVLLNFADELRRRVPAGK
jgi:serine/threonine-protein kinase